MRKRLLFALGSTWLALLISAVALSFAAAANDTLPADESITDWLQARALPGQELSDAVRTLTATEVVLATGAAVALILWLRGHRRHAIALAAGLVALAILQPAIKELVDRPRPSSQLVEIRAGGSSPSFPAGHVMSGTFLYGFLLYVALSLPMPKTAAALMAVASVAVLLLNPPANVWLGVHWPSDVLGGVVWAALILLPTVIGAGSKNTDFPPKFTIIR